MIVFIEGKCFNAGIWENRLFTHTKVSEVLPCDIWCESLFNVCLKRRFIVKNWWFILPRWKYALNSAPCAIDDRHSEFSIVNMFAATVRRSCGIASYGCRAGAAYIYSEPFRIKVYPQRCAPQFTTAAAGRFEFPPVPPDVLREIDQKKPLANSVNLYQRHFSVSSGE